jgi:hypothetical protein
MAWQSWKQENEVSYVSSRLLKIKLPLGVAPRALHLLAKTSLASPFYVVEANTNG